MSVPEEILWKLETYAFGHGGQFGIGPEEDRVCVAVKFHPHTFSLAWMFAEDVFRKCGIEAELRPSLLDRIVEPDTEQVAKLFLGELKRFAQAHGGRFVFARNLNERVPMSPMKVYCDFADEQLAVDWLGEMIAMLSVPAVARCWSRLGETPRKRILENGATLDENWARKQWRSDAASGSGHDKQGGTQSND